MRLTCLQVKLDLNCKVILMQWKVDWVSRKVYIVSFKFITFIIYFSTMLVSRFWFGSKKLLKQITINCKTNCIQLKNN